MPDILIGGGDSINGPIGGLLGPRLLEELGNKQTAHTTTEEVK